MNRGGSRGGGGLWGLQPPLLGPDLKYLYVSVSVHPTGPNGLNLLNSLIGAGLSLIESDVAAQGSELSAFLVLAIHVIR